MDKLITGNKSVYIVLEVFFTHNDLNEERQWEKQDPLRSFSTHTHTRNSIAVIESNINYRFSKIPVYHFASKTTLDDKQKCVT